MQAAPFSVFVCYNEAIYPLQLMLILIAGALALVAIRPGEWSTRIVWVGLALLWAWCGGVFFIKFYGPQGPAPMIFGAAFLLQAVVFALAAFRNDGGAMRLRSDARGITAGVLMGYAVLIYPLLADALGQHYPAQPTFGAPCPLTIFTFGLLVMFTGRVPAYLLVVPLFWAAMGLVPIFRWGVYEDIMLPVAGVLGVILILKHNRTVARAATAGVGETPAPMEGTRRLQ